MASEELATLAGIKVENLINFQGKCVDPLAQLIVDEALAYAIGAADRRLKSLGKIFHRVEQTGLPALAMVQAVRRELSKVPTCGGKSMLGKTPVTKDDLLKALVEAQKAHAAAGGKPPEPPKIKVTIAPEPPEPPKKRAQAERWNIKTGGIRVRGLEGKSFATPGELARYLGIDITGASGKEPMLVAFRRAGFGVTGNGEVTKGGEKFEVYPLQGTLDEAIKNIPEKYRLPAKSPVEPELPKPVKQPKMRLMVAKRLVDNKPTIVGYDIIDGDAVVGRMTVEQGRQAIEQGKAVVT